MSDDLKTLVAQEVAKQLAAIAADQTTKKVLEFLKQSGTNSCDLISGYVRLENGLQVCWFYGECQFSSHQYTHTWPVPFYDSQYGVAFEVKRSSSQPNRIVEQSSSTLAISAVEAYNAKLSVSFISAGRWK